MARNKDATGSDSPPAAPVQKYRIHAPVGRHVAGDIVTADDLFPGLDDQAEIDGHTRRLLSLAVIAPHVEFATPEPEAVVTESITPIRVVPSGPATPNLEMGSPPTVAPTFTVPSFQPAETDEVE